MNTTRARGSAAASTVAHAKLVAAWPDGNECVVGSAIRWLTCGRLRGIMSLSPLASRSATRSAPSVTKKIDGRRRYSASTAAMTRKTIPSCPMRDSSSNGQFSHETL